MLPLIVILLVFVVDIQGQEQAQYAQPQNGLHPLAESPPTPLNTAQNSIQISAVQQPAPTNPLNQYQLPTFSQNTVAIAPSQPVNPFPLPASPQNPLVQPGYALPLPPNPFPVAAPSAGCNSCSQPQYYMGSDGNYYYYNGQPASAAGAAGGETTTEEPTTKGPPNRFNEAGWETDDNGNVYVGNDDAKLYLISVGSYWPFPKDYRKKREISGPSLEQLLGFSKL